MILIINPPNPPEGVSNKDTMGGLGQVYSKNSSIRMPAIDIFYTAGVLRQNNIPVRVVDFLIQNISISQFIFLLKKWQPEFIAFRTSTPTVKQDLEFIENIYRLYGKTKIVIFGPHVSLSPEPIIQHQFVDMVIVGEPEMTMLDLAQSGPEKCAGLWYKKSGQVIKNQAREPIDNLDSLPYPAWDVVPYQLYDLGSVVRNLKPVVTVLSSRGCPYGCFYCPYPVIQGRKLRVRSAEGVVEELSYLSYHLGIRAVLFRDPEFALQRERVVKICEELIRRQIKIAWRCETRLEDLDENLIQLMARAGCLGINVGIESASQAVVEGLGRKSIPLEKAQTIIKACRRNKIESFCFFIIGLPGETRATFLETIQYFDKLNPDFAQFTVATPYPGTKLREWATKKGFIERESLNSLTGYEAVMRNENLTVAEMQKLQKLAYRQWHSRPTRLIRKVIKKLSLVFNNFLEKNKVYLSFSVKHMDLKNKVSIITGGGTGIGRALALKLAAQGATVVICGRRPEPLNEVVALIKKSGGEAMATTADISNGSQVKRLAEAVLSKYGRIDILINNAGIAIVKPILAITEEEWDSTIDTNLKGVFNCCQTVLPSLIKSGHGIIVNIASILGQRGIANYGAYSASKFGVIGLSQALAEEVKSQNVKIFIINPGATKTDLHRQLVDEGDFQLAMRPEKVADKIIDLIRGKIFLSSGEALTIDEGRNFFRRCRRKIKYLIIKLNPKY